MSRIERFNAQTKPIIISALSTASFQITDYVVRQIGSQTISALISVVVVVLSVLILNQVIEYLIDKSVSLRKLILGDDFIEGLWLDLSWSEDDLRVEHGAIIQIQFKQGHFQINGTSYDGAGQKMASFNSLLACYGGKTLFYEYTAHTRYAIGTTSKTEQGITNLLFDSPPESFTGSWTGYSSQKHSRLEGRKLQAAELAAHNKLKTPMDKEKFIVEEIKAHNQRLANSLQA